MREKEVGRGTRRENEKVEVGMRRTDFSINRAPQDLL